MEFPCGSLGASLFHSTGDSGLADQTKQIPCPCHLANKVDSSANSAGFITGLKPCSNLYSVELVDHEEAGSLVGAGVSSTSFWLHNRSITSLSSGAQEFNHLWLNSGQVTSSTEQTLPYMREVAVGIPVTLLSVLTKAPRGCLQSVHSTSFFLILYRTLLTKSWRR
jgi:hypothetical protein